MFGFVQGGKEAGWYGEGIVGAKRWRLVGVGYSLRAGVMGMRESDGGVGGWYGVEEERYRRLWNEDSKAASARNGWEVGKRGGWSGWEGDDVPGGGRSCKRRTVPAQRVIPERCI